MNDVSDTRISAERLAPWPLGGYAPGRYSCTCADCGKTFEGDKRAMQCLECAVSEIKTQWQNLASRHQEPVSEPGEWRGKLHMTRKALERAEKFAADYEFDSDEGFHVPSDLERVLMLDMLNGLFDDEEFIAALDGAATPIAPVPVTDEMVERACAMHYPTWHIAMTAADMGVARGNMHAALTAALSAKPTGEV